MFIFGVLVTALAAQSTAPALPFLSPVFGSHMVLQRDRPNTFWGWTAPGERVKVTLDGRSATGVADQAGKWIVRINPPATGGPYSVAVDGSQHVRLDDVLVGDVWLCSGQSNMEMGLGVVNNAAAEIAAANYPGMRLYMVQRNPSLEPVTTPQGSWAVCSPTAVGTGWGSFSAAAYFFGRELHKRLGIPIGLIETCWGGTVAEAWTSRKGLGAFPEFNPAFQAIDSLTASHETAGQKLDKWMRANDPGSAHGADWAAPEFDDSQWIAAPGAASFEANGLGGVDGVVWMRKEVTLDSAPTGDATLQLGYVDDMDTVWVNGVQVGEHFAVVDWRTYRVPASALRAGRNVIAVRVLDTGGLGGMPSPDQQVLTLSDGTAMPLAGGWRLALGVDLQKAAKLPVMYTGDPNVPTVLNNGMIAPLVPVAIKGAIWYQGESNAGRAAQYQRLLPAMIGDWRTSWHQGDFPFLIVQLANFAQRHPQPVNDAWAELREAQTLTAQRVRNTGMAVAIDIGDDRDIHPKNKQDVGLRLALSALHVAYGQNLVYSGPTFRSARREGGALRVRFDHADGGLVARGDRLAGFQVAGADRKFAWAEARIEGNDVVLTSASVPEPLWVRYAWDMNPEATLYNGAGLPAVPFRTGG